jgi:hypothetical protein
MNWTKNQCSEVTIEFYEINNLGMFQNLGIWELQQEMMESG